MCIRDRCECLKVARNASNLSGRLIAAGVGSMIAFQSFVNIGVATNLLPNTGLPLPFIDVYKRQGGVIAAVNK